MRRWNGWGDDGTVGTLPPGSSECLDRIIGPATPPRDATFDEALATVGESRLPAHRLVSADAADRLLHARGQSLPDWVALRTGRIGRVPDGVGRPGDAAEVRELLRWAASIGACVIPYGGGTGVTGAFDLTDGDAPALTVDLSRMAGMTRLDEVSGLAAFGPGTPGPDVEAALRARGRTLGHYPQSWELSTVGGWVATRSVGQQSRGYGRIDERFAGGTLEAPAGTLELLPHPGSAAGPDLRGLVLGSEGRLGILTNVVLRTSMLPEVEAFRAVFFPDWDRALAGIRALAQAELPLSMIRLSTPAEAETNLALAGHAEAMRLLRAYVGRRGAGRGRAMAVVGFTGRRRMVAAAARETFRLLAGYGAVRVPRVGSEWRKSRFRSPYLRNTLWDAGYAVDTLETAVDWATVPSLAAGLAPMIRRALADEGERVHAFMHLSHVYPTGSSVYVTYVYRLDPDPDVTLRRWRTVKEAASRVIVEHGGTISHQHGVGRDHRPWLPAEKGELGIAAIRDAAARFDPHGIMIPGVLVDDEGGEATR